MILLGGPLHGSEVNLPEGAVHWVDLRLGHTYHRDHVTFSRRDPITRRVTHLFKAPVLVFEEVRAIEPLPVRAAAVNQLVTDVALRMWFSEHNDGIDHPIPSEPGGPSNGRRGP